MKNAHSQTNNSKKQEQAGVKDVQTPSSPPQPPSSPLSEGDEDDSLQLSPSQAQPQQAEPKGKSSRKRDAQQHNPAAGRSGAIRKAPSVATTTTRNPPAGHQVDTTSGPSSSSSSTSAMVAVAAQAGKGSQLLPSSLIYDNIHCTHPQVNGYILYKDLRERNLPGPREPGGAYLPKEYVIGNNFCYRCGFWYKKNHNLYM